MIMQEAPRRPPGADPRGNVRAPIPPPSQAAGGRSPGSIQRGPAIQRIQQQPGAPASQPGPAFPQQQRQQSVQGARPAPQQAQQPGPPQHAAPSQVAAPRAPITASPNRGAPMRPPVEMSPQPPPVGQQRHDLHFDHRPESQGARFAPQPTSQRGASQFPPPQQRVSQFPPPQQHAQQLPYPSQAPPPYGPQGFSPMPPAVQQGPMSAAPSQGYGAPAQSFAPTPHPQNLRYTPSQPPTGFPAPSLPPHFAQQQQGVPSTARASAFPGRRRSSDAPPESIVPVGPVPPQQILAASVFLGVPLALATLLVAVLALRGDPGATEMQPNPAASSSASPAASGQKKAADAPAVGPEHPR